MGKGKGKPGKGQNAPFSDAALEQRYQKLLRDRWAAGKDTISRARYARQLGHTGGNREPPSNLPNLHRSVEAPRAKPKATPKVQRTPPPPPPKRRKSDPDASRPSEPAPASQVAQVEETSPAPVQAPQVLVPEPQAAQPDTTQPMAGAGGDAPVPPSPAPVEGPTLEPAQASNLDSSSIQAAQSKAPEEAPPGTTAGTVETAQAEESSPAAKVPTEEVPLPSAQVEEASPTKAEPPSFLPFEFPDSSAPSLPHSEASPAQAKSATGEAEAPAHTSARSLLSSSTDDSDMLEPVASPQDEESSPELKRELPEISSAQDPEDLSALYKEFLATPKVLSGEVKHHKGTANSPWTCYLPSSLTDEEGRVWYVFGVGRDRATLAPPASLGRAHAHQVLKIGRPDSMTPERKYFALLHRDFNYVTRPAGYGTTTVRLADNARTSTQGFVLECECVYYQKVAPVDKQLGSQRQLQVPDLLAALAIVAHLSSLYLRVADIGGHNLGWGIEPLAIGAEANHILQERALRHRPHVPLILFDAGRWRESPAISFPGAKATKGLLGLIERYPDFHSWVLSQIRSYHNAQALCIAFLHRLRQYEAHWEGVMSSGLVTFLPLTLRPGLLIPTRSPWEREEETTWQIVPVFDRATPARVTS